jgi:hypothetical protein
MALTRDFRDTIRERAQREPSFRQALLREGLQLINSGDFAIGRSILRNYINATIGFPRLARATKISSPSLQRMFGPHGNPSAQNLFGVIAALQKAEGVSFELQIEDKTPIHSAITGQTWQTTWNMVSACKSKAAVYETFVSKPGFTGHKETHSAPGEVSNPGVPHPVFISEYEELEMAS